ncbi:MAG: 4Fe-4S binding protein, partial [Candidatus Bipolaricaulota bacterium]|nr:4Fe-4S binding protein [Candidatus Bipolaricaulota bacterium]
AAGVADAAAEASAHVSWRWIAFALAALLVVPAALLRRAGRARVLLTAALLVVGGAALGLGVSLDQHRQAQAVGAVLCTSCVGIETVETLSPRLSSAQAAAVDRLTEPVDLLVFYAPWCRSCPYVEGLVDLIASRNPLVHYRLVNAEIERDLAAQHGDPPRGYRRGLVRGRESGRPVGDPARGANVKLAHGRRISQGAGVVFGLLGVTGIGMTHILFPGLHCYACPWAITVCPVGLVQNLVIFGTVPFFWLGAMIVYGLVAARGFCGWFCPFGTLNDLLSFRKAR